jgi:hypothetical protein
MNKLLSVMATVALLIPACGGGAVTDDQGRDGALFRIDSEGGFAPMEWILGRGPLYTLTTDGRLLSQGVVPAIFPGPLVLPYLVTQLTEGEMGQIRQMIGRMGLADMVDERDDSNSNFVADATTEVITYWDGAGTHRYSVYALGLDDGRGAKSQATETFAELRNILDSIAFGRETTPYEPEKVRVIVGPGMSDPEFFDLRDWPFPESDPTDWAGIDDTWSCRSFEGTHLGLFTTATSVTRWKSPTAGGIPAELQLLVRPLHPGEEDCPAEIPLGG